MAYLLLFQTFVLIIESQRKNWLGGMKVNGENVTGFDGLSQQLIQNFSLLETGQLTQTISLNAHTSINRNLMLSIWQLND